MFNPKGDGENDFGAREGADLSERAMTAITNWALEGWKHGSVVPSALSFLYLSH
jgi:hypothetical protein